MRVILLVLISISNSLASSIIEKIDKALSDIPTTLNKAELLATTEILHAHDKAVERQLQLSPQQELELHRLETEAAQLGHAYYDNHTITQINHQSHIDELLYQSDIILTTEQAQMIANDEEAMVLERERSKRQALNWNHWKNYMWPNGVLYYSFAVGTNMRTKDIFRKGAALWMEDTCVLLIENSAAQQRVEVQPWEPACSSFVGWIQEGVQRLKFGEQCNLIGTAAHELGHALGMFHTHARHDRDQYLIVNMRNVVPGGEKNFNKETTTTNNNYGIPFDYGSIMMYGARTGITYSLQNNKAAFTMMPKDINFIDTMGSTHVAFYDVLLLNKMYDCLKKCDGKQYSPTQDRLKRQTWTRTVTRIGPDGRRVTETSSGTGPSGFTSFTSRSRSDSFSEGDDIFGDNPFAGFGSFGGMNPFDGFDLGDLTSHFGGFFGGRTNIGGLQGEEGSSVDEIWGHNGGDLPREEGGRNPDGGLPGEEGGRDTSNPGGEEGGMNPNNLPGEEGSNTEGRTAWWNLPGQLGGLLPDWIWNFGAGWDWEYTAIPPTTTTTTSRPTTSRRPSKTTKTPRTTTSRYPPSRTTTTTPAPGPGPTYNTAKCTNGGYPSPKDCSRCACPRGYGGRYCNERPAGAGKILEATTKFQTLARQVGWPNVRRTDDTDDFVFEYYWIKAPQGRKIEVKITDLDKQIAVEGCYWAAVEIKFQKDQRLTGVRACSPTFIGKSFKSEHNLVPVIMYSKMWPVDMAVQYRLV